MTVHYDFADVLAASKRVNWSVEDLIGGNRRLDFSKPFMPASLARDHELTFLTEKERMVFNQIRGHSYLYIFGLAEEFILPFVEEHARREGVDMIEGEAFQQFAAEEAKHIELFKRFRDEFQRDFGTSIEVIGPPEAVAKAVLEHHPLAVAIATLHIEWMTQRHYLDSVKNDASLCPQFESLLKHHWMEEAQHAKLDTNMVLDLADGLSGQELQKVLDDYVSIGGLLDEGFKTQAQFDLDAFERATGRKLTLAEREIYNDQQTQAFRWTYLGSGMTHPKFLETLETIAPFMRDAVEAVSPTFC